MGAEWFAVDWGTSNLRAWAIGADGAVLGHARSDRGMGRLSPDGFEPALRELLAPWTEGPAEVVVCGMAGARQGWIEAPYATVPCPPLPPGLTRAPTRTPGLSVGIIPGLCQRRPADVMRGEETQIAGFLALDPGWEGVLCLPGTHTKWVAVSAGEVVGFRTAMTGELFASLSRETVLRHALAGAEGLDSAAFDAALSDSLSAPEALALRLFAIRAESLLDGLPPAAARARLSGLLLGAELAATRPWWLGRRIAIIGTGTVAGLYARALAAQGVPAETADNDRVTLAGLMAARTRARESR